MKKSNFIKDALILFIITLVSGLSLGGVYEITKAPIANALEKSKQAAYKQVFASAEKFEQNSANDDAIANSVDEILGLGLGNVRVDAVVDALNSSGEVLGHVITTTSKDGYGGEVQISVGVQEDGKVNGIAFLSLNETPGLGMNANKPEFYNQFNEKTVDKFTVSKVASDKEDTIQAISGATITSNAVTNAVNTAIYFATHVIGDKKGESGKEPASPYTMAFPTAVFFDELEVDLEKLNADILSSDYKDINIEKVFAALNSEEEKLGYMFTVTYKKAYAGDITAVIGMDMEAKVQGIGYTTLNETPGLGMRVTEESFYGQYLNKKVDKFEFALNEAVKDSDIVAISGATISSNAVNQIVNASITALSKYFDVNKEYKVLQRVEGSSVEGVDATSSSTPNGNDAVSSNSPVVEKVPLTDEEIYEEAFSAAEAVEEIDFSKENIDNDLNELGYTKVSVEKALTALDSNGKKIGNIIILNSKEAYHEEMELALGINTKGSIEGISFIDISETDGLGMKVTQEEFYSQYLGKETEKFEFEKIDSIAGATISSKAVNNIINAALYFNNKYLGE